MIAGRNRISIASAALFAALGLQFFMTISLPYISSVYIIATSFSSDSSSSKGNVSFGNFQSLTQIRMGIWAACFYAPNNSTCLSAKAGYSVTVTENKSQVDIGSSWTSGLPLQIVATGFTIIALPLTHFYFYNDNTTTGTTMCTVGVAGLASILTLLIECALYFYVNNKMQTLGPEAGITSIGPAMWLGLVSSALLGTAFARLYFTRHDSQGANVPVPQEVNQAEKIPVDIQQSGFNPNPYGVARPGVQPYLQPYPPQPYPQTYQPQGHQGPPYQGSPQGLYQGPQPGPPQVPPQGFYQGSPPQGLQGPPQAYSGQPQAYRQDRGVGEFDPPPYIGT